MVVCESMVRCGCGGGAGRVLPLVAVAVGVVAVPSVLAVLGLVVTWCLVAVAVVAGSAVLWWAVREVVARRQWARACREAAASRRAAAPALPAPVQALPAPRLVRAVARRLDREEVPR